MRWNQFLDDPARAMALGDLLMAAASAAGGFISEARLAVVHGQIAKVLGVSVLPAAIVAHVDRFGERAFDLDHACRALRIASARERVALLKAIVLVIRADGPVARDARAFALRLATHVGLSWTSALGLVGPPARPITGERPRPTLRALERVEPMAASSR
jgi:hypothetical protein